MNKKYSLDPKKPPQKFSHRKTLRNGAVNATVAALGMGTLAAVLETVQPGASADMVQVVAEEAGTAAYGALVLTYAGEYANHKLDDPSPVFDGKTTALYNMTGLTLCFLLFVLPALSLDHMVTDGNARVGMLTHMALWLSVFVITISRGLLINLGLVRAEDDIEHENFSDPA